mgnify:FL=1
MGTNEEAFECVKFAWEVGAGDINATDDNGDTALHGAAHRESQAIVEFLVSKGAKLDIRNKISWTPLSITLGVYYPSSYKRHPETAEVLRRLGAKDEGVRRDIDLSPTELESLAGKK